MQQQKSTAKTTVKANKNESTNTLWKNSAEPGEPKKMQSPKKVNKKLPKPKTKCKICDKIMINNAKKTREIRPSFSSYCKKDV